MTTYLAPLHLCSCGTGLLFQVSDVFTIMLGTRSSSCSHGGLTFFLADKVDTVKQGKSVSRKKGRKKSASRSAQSLLVKTRFTWELQTGTTTVKNVFSSIKQTSRGSRNSYCTIRFLAGLTKHGLNTRNSNAVKRESQGTKREAESRDPTPPSLAVQSEFVRFHLVLCQCHLTFKILSQRKHSSPTVMMSPSESTADLSSVSQSREL